MSNNPFASLVEAFRDEPREETLVQGVVTSWPTEKRPDLPHKILVGGNTQEREELLKNINIGPYGLSDGDSVLLLPIEGAQRYIILCKVVGL